MKPWAAIALAALLAAGPASADNLREALAHAYTSNPQILAARSNLRIVNENFPQARSVILPQLTASASAGYRTTDESGTAFASDSELEPTVAQLNLSQSLYTGGRGSAGMRQAKASINAARASLNATTHDVMFAGVQAYTGVLATAEIVEIRRESVRALVEQLEATQARFDVGELTRTDVAQAEARLSLARGDLSSAQAQFLTARADYEQVFGFQPASLEPLPDHPPLPETEEDARQTALAWNPELISARYVEEASIHGVDVARADLRPRVTLQGSLTRREDINFQGETEEAASLTAQVSVPLFTGGFERSQVRAAKHQVNRDRERVRSGERIIMEEVSAAWSAWRSAQEIVLSSRDAVRAAEIALDGIREEQAYGLRSTLDVLNTEIELRNAQIRLVNARREEYIAAHRLLSVMGLLTPDYLELPIREYDAEADYQADARRILSTSIEP